LMNCIMWNSGTEEIYFHPWIEIPYTITISYSDIQGGESGIVTNIFGTVNWMDGNINTDPLFVDYGNRDYRLQSTSPCIDAGSYFSPLDPDSTRTDMGAYYFYQIPIVAEFTSSVNNGYSPLSVDFTDLSTQAEGQIDEWYWDFGDGEFSSDQNPTHIFSDLGYYTIFINSNRY